MCCRTSQCIGVPFNLDDYRSKLHTLNHDYVLDNKHPNDIVHRDHFPDEFVDFPENDDESNIHPFYYWEEMYERMETTNDHKQLKNISY